MKTNGIEFVPPPLCADNAAAVWLALQEKEASGLAHQRDSIFTDPDVDPLTADERQLYRILTKRLVADSAIQAIALTESANPPAP